MIQDKKPLKENALLLKMEEQLKWDGHILNIRTKFKSDLKKGGGTDDNFVPKK